MEKEDDRYQIRLARPDDLPLLGDIENSAAILFRDTPYAFVIDHPPLKISILRECQRHARVWVAVDRDDRPAGFAVAGVRDGMGYLHELDVHPDHGRRGLGARLTNTVCRWASEVGFDAVTLSTFRNIPWNAPFYRRLGFREMSESEIGPELRAEREKELESGFTGDDRVMMIKELEDGCEMPV